MDISTQFKNIMSFDAANFNNVSPEQLQEKLSELTSQTIITSVEVQRLKLQLNECESYIYRLDAQIDRSSTSNIDNLIMQKLQFEAKIPTLKQAFNETQAYIDKLKLMRDKLCKDIKILRSNRKI